MLNPVPLLGRNPVEAKMAAEFLSTAPMRQNVPTASTDRFRLACVRAHVEKPTNAHIASVKTETSGSLPSKPS